MLLNPGLFALSDPVWRAILTCLKEGELLMSELAARFDISLEAVSRHIQVWCALVWCTRSDPGVLADAALTPARSMPLPPGSSAIVPFGGNNRIRWQPRSYTQTTPN